MEPFHSWPGQDEAVAPGNKNIAITYKVMIAIDMGRGLIGFLFILVVAKLLSPIIKL